MVTLSGGDKLSKALADIAKNLSKAAAVDIGFLENSTYLDGVSVPMVAAIQEFGAPSVGIPPRPFFRTMIVAKSPEWPEGIAEQLKAHDYDAGKALTATGDAIKGQLQQSIVDFVGAPLSPSTIERKGTDKQLVDTGHMLASVNFAVK